MKLVAFQCCFLSIACILLQGCGALKCFLSTCVLILQVNDEGRVLLERFCQRPNSARAMTGPWNPVSREQAAMGMPLDGQGGCGMQHP